MPADHILVPLDFTPATQTALNHASAIASKTDDVLTLLHVMKSGEIESETRDKLEAYSERIKTQYGLASELIGVHGEVLKQIEDASRTNKYHFMVLATHGLKNLKQKLFGADALHIAQNAGVPVIIVQENSADPKFEKIVFPYGGHQNFASKIKATVELARRFNSEVHIYSIDRPGEKPTQQALANISDAKRAFIAAGIRHLEVHEELKVISIGFARQTLAYAEQIGAGMIAVMAGKTTEYSHISQADKEALINNKAGIPIMLSGDKVPL